MDKYLDTLLSSRTAQKALPPTIAKSGNRKMADCLSYYEPFLPNQSQQSSFAVIGYAEAGRRRSPMM